MDLILLLPLFYLIGSIPTGYIISHAKGVDIKKVGSGNIGGTNVGRALGRNYGILVILLDALKGYIPLYIAHLFHNEHILLLGITLIVGHIFSVFMNYKGGKGVATMIGVGLSLVTIQYFLVFVILWVISLHITRLMSLTNLIVVWGFPLYYLFFDKNISACLLSLSIVALVYYGHRENIKRLLNRTEKKLY